MKAKEWWKNNGEEWLKQVKEYEDNKRLDSDHYKIEADFLVDEIEKCISPCFGAKILEVGAGNGRIISRVARVEDCENNPYFDCFSIDINPELSKYVKEKYPYVQTFVGEIINLPFKDKEFDLVFTHEVLQHIEPSEIDQACKELIRVGKEVWCMESWRDEKDGLKVSDSHCGRWNYDLKKRMPVYYDFYTDWKQIFIKAK